MIIHAVINNYIFVMLLELLINLVQNELMSPSSLNAMLD
jgi:hypothetical protein